MSQPYAWDFFISHAGPDAELARSLYRQLQPPALVFLDTERLMPGDTWAKVLPEALKNSLISIILISPNSDNAYYEQDEIAIAIEQTRTDPHTHRVIPVYVNNNPAVQNTVPFGLKSKHSLYVAGAADFATAREKLLQTMEIMKGLEIKKTEVVAQQRQAVASITNPRNNADLLAGLLGITSMVRPLMLTLIVLFVIAVGLLIVFMLMPVADRVPLLLSDGSLCLLLLGSIFVLIERALRLAPQLASGNINAG